MAVAFVGHLVNDGDSKSQLLSELLENGGIAFAAPAKMKIISGDDMSRFQFFNYILLDKVLRLQLGKRLVKMELRTKEAPGLRRGGL